MARLAVRLGPLALRNPVLCGSGTFGHGAEMQQLSPLGELGGLVSKTVTLKPRPGNPMPRMAETEAGLLNSIGLENRGIEFYVREILPQMADIDTVVVTNIGAEREEEFGELAARLEDHSAVDALEVNLSCPNVGGGKLPFSTDPRMAEAAVARVRGCSTKPIFAKLSPNVSDIGEIARACEAAGADGLTAVNTLLGMKVDWRTGRPAIATIQGGYSGVGVKPVALRQAWVCCRAVRIPVMGCGGIRTADDALEFLSVGCRAVQVGTANFSDPALLARLPCAIAQAMDAAGLGDVERVIGSLGRERAVAH
jgi:dihydroorotate dehydrogenase (NAD+) catalytic subunit